MRANEPESQGRNWGIDQSIRSLVSRSGILQLPLLGEGRGFARGQTRDQSGELSLQQMWGGYHRVVECEVGLVRLRSKRNVPSFGPARAAIAIFCQVCRWQLGAFASPGVRSEPGPHEFENSGSENLGLEA